MNIYEDFLEWMYNLVDAHGYAELLKILYDTEFYTILPQDDNRLIDGRDLRYRFASEMNIPRHILDVKLGEDYCSVLEMMVGLAVRIEETIMSDVDFGNRTSMWFWIMIKSLGLYDMRDGRCNKREVKDIIETFLNRGYESNGAGGLFTVKDTSKDMRDVEIWYQMCMFFDNLL